MSLSRAEAPSVSELRELVAMLERSGMADRRPDVRALLDASRLLLHGRPVPRSRPSMRQLAGKLGAVIALALDGVVLVALPILLWSAERGAWMALLAAPLWLGFRLRGRLAWLYEPWFVARYHLAWAYDWFAEAFNDAAMRRLEARLAAREVMAAWRRHRLILPRRAVTEDVAGFLDVTHGPQAAGAFRRSAGVMQGGAARRLAALRWSALIRQFEGLAASGALWPELAPTVSDPAIPLPEAHTEEQEPSERAARRADVGDLIRRKRQDITTAFGWKLKTAAEIAQRDGYLAELRAEIGLLERELALLGG